MIYISSLLITIGLFAIAHSITELAQALDKLAKAKESVAYTMRMTEDRKAAKAIEARMSGPRVL